MSSYNPFYIPPLKTLEQQAKNEANAQINAAVGALPSEGTINTQFAARGRSLGGFDDAFINFLKAQNTANAAQAAPPDLNPPPVTSGGQQTPGTAAEAAAAARASAMLGIGYKNQGIALQNAAGATKAANQGANRKSLFDAIQQRATQVSGEKAKFGSLYADILHGKKSDAFNAYQAYLNNQLNAGQLSQTAGFNQGKLDISQQNADTNAQNANTRATGGANSAVKPPTSAERGKVQDYIDGLISNKTSQKQADTTYHTYSITIMSGSPASPHQVVIGEWPAGTDENIILNKAKAQYPHSQINGVNVTGTRVAPGGTKSVSTYNYAQIWNRAWRRYKTLRGVTTRQAKKMATSYLTSVGLRPPPTPGAAPGGRPSDTGV